jgi:hypothetical protein
MNQLRIRTYWFGSCPLGLLSNDPFSFMLALSARG